MPSRSSSWALKARRFAWESVDGEAYYNPEFLKGYEGQGKPLHMSEGLRVTLHLKTIPAAEDQP